MPKKMKSIPDSEESESEAEAEATYDVEFIRKAKISQDEKWEYLIKWGGYPEGDNSWEPESNLTGCRRILKSFWEQIGPKFKNMNKRLPIGHEVKPSSLWIERERRAYRKSSEKKKNQKKLQDDKSSEGEINDDDEEVRSNTPEVSKETHEESSSDVSDIPLSSKALSKTKDQVDDDVVSITSQTTHSLKRKGSNERDTDGHKRRRTEAASVISASDSAMTRLQTIGTMQESIRLTSLSASVSSTTDTGVLPSASKSSISLLPSKSTPATDPPSNKSIAQMSSALPVSISNKQIPAHQQRKLNPRVKPMALLPLKTDGPVGISTKSRISGLGTGAVEQRSAQPTLRPASPAIVTRPSTTANTLDSPITPQSSTHTGLDTSRRPQENIITTDLASAPPPQTSSTNSSHNLHFSKRWRWTGQLVVGNNESDNAFVEPVGGILLTEYTTLDYSTDDLGIQQLIPAHVDSLFLRHSYPLASLPALLADFRIAYFARMSADKSNEDNSFSDLVAYMTKHELFSLTPLFVSDDRTATMTVFPACFQYLWDQLGVPPKSRQEHDLLVVIGFQIYKPTRGALGEVMKSYSSHWNTGKLDVLSESRTLECSRALHALGFPDSLFKRIAHKECAVFTTSIDKESPGPDTIALDRVLRNAPGCKIVTVLDGDARFIFIHVAAWSLLHRLVGLVDRRRRRQDVQFYTYGSDPTVEPKHWRVHEVFPIGGVVTFTARAIVENPEGIGRLISKLNEHPLWECYILPSVVAKIVDVVKSDNGPDSKIIEALCKILIPIERGEIALTWHPPSHRAWHKETPSDKDLVPERVSWMIDQAHLSELRNHELVAECQKRLQRSPYRSEKEVESSMVMDMVVMQSELRQLFRRFVIVTDSTGASNISREAAASRSASQADIKDGFEFTHVDEFAFGDDYSFDDS